MFRHVLSLAALSLLLPLTTARAADWPSLRGPDHNGVSRETGWRADWRSEAPPVAWRAHAGIGVSGFAVSGDRVVTMGNEDDTDVVRCFHAGTGEVLWEVRYPAPLEWGVFVGPFSEGTAATPAIDGDRVYTLGWEGLLHCIDLEEGTVLWRVHLVDDLGGQPSEWKYAGSPLIVDDLVILDAGGEGASTVALDKRTGERVWAGGDDAAAYATPVPLQHGGTPAVLVFKAEDLVAKALADGRELWRIPWETAYDVNASSPIVLETPEAGLLVSSGYPQTGRMALYRFADGTPSGPVWENRDVKTQFNNAVVHEGLVFAITEARRGRLMCLDLETGETLWSVDEGVGRNGTLKLAGQHLLILSDSGELITARPSRERFEELGRMKVLDGTCWAGPVLSHGRIFARNNEGEVVCVDVRE